VQDADQPPVENLREQVDALQWHHTIDLGNGITTPGTVRVERLIQQALEDISFAGKKVLDIGCWDGFWSFDAEKRGAAEVYATDDVSQRPGGAETFELAHQALKSTAKYFPHVSVYDLREKLDESAFDVVLCLGVHYHLKYPLLAFSRIRQVITQGGLLVVSGQAIPDYRRSYADFYYRKTYYHDKSNWWIPTIACLREWCECSHFEIVRELPHARPTLNSRYKMFLRRFAPQAVRGGHLIVARAIAGKETEGDFPDPELSHH
jgi:tRNA (mo5U34)-methyltransferase